MSFRDIGVGEQGGVSSRHVPSADCGSSDTGESTIRPYTEHLNTGYLGLGVTLRAGTVMALDLPAPIGEKEGWKRCTQAARAKRQETDVARSTLAQLRCLLVTVIFRVMRFHEPFVPTIGNNSKSFVLRVRALGSNGHRSTQKWSCVSKVGDSWMDSILLVALSNKVIAGTEVLRRRESDNSFKEKSSSNLLCDRLIHFVQWRTTYGYNTCCMQKELNASASRHQKAARKRCGTRTIMTGNLHTLWTQRIGFSLRGYHGSKCSHDHTIGRR